MVRAQDALLAFLFGAMCICFSPSMLLDEALGTETLRTRPVSLCQLSASFHRGGHARCVEVEVEAINFRTSLFPQAARTATAGL